MQRAQVFCQACNAVVAVPFSNVVVEDRETGIFTVACPRCGNKGDGQTDYVDELLEFGAVLRQPYPEKKPANLPPLTKDDLIDFHFDEELMAL